MIAVQALEKRTAELKQKEAQIAVLESRLEALELRQNQSDPDNSREVVTIIDFAQAIPTSDGPPSS